MTSTARTSKIAGRLVRNLVATLCVTAIFAFKAIEPHDAPPALDLFAAASH